MVAELEESRDLTRAIVHVDMDAFYAAVEMRDCPELKDKPMAVGSMSMLVSFNLKHIRFNMTCLGSADYPIVISFCSTLGKNPIKKCFPFFQFDGCQNHAFFKTHISNLSILYISGVIIHLTVNIELPCQEVWCPSSHAWFHRKETLSRLGYCSDQL